MKRKTENENEGLPPHSMEAEQGVLGCLLLEPGLVVEVLAKMRGGAEAFYHLPHRKVFETITAMAGAGQVVDLITVQQRLKDAGELDGIGGLSYLVSLQDAVPSAANLSYYIEIVREKWVLRQVVRKLAELQGRARALESSADEFAAACVMELGSVSAMTEGAEAAKPIKAFVKEALDRLEAHYVRGNTQFPPGSIRTGLDYLDKVLQGILPSDLVFITGRMGTGKTALASEIVVRNSDVNEWEQQAGVDENGKPIWESRKGGLPMVIFSMEMTGESLATRMLFRKARLSMGKWNQGYRQKQDLDKIAAAAAELARANVLVDEAEFQTVEQLIAKARRHKEKQGTRLFILDYVTLLRLQRSTGDKVKDLTEISTMLRAAAKALRVPWLILAQMNRAIETTETWRRPTLADIKDCDAFATDASKVLMLHQPAPPKVRFKKDEAGDPIEVRDARGDEEAAIDEWFAGTGERDHTERPSRLDCYVAKNRFGPTGNAELLFLKNMQLFEDWHAWEAQQFPEKRNKGEHAGKWKQKETEI